MFGKGQLVAQLRSLGVREGDLLMVHSSLRAIGPVAGGPATLLDALLDCLGAQGTLAASVSWQHSSYEATLGGRALTAAERDAWPVFDPATAPPSTASASSTASFVHTRGCTAARIPTPAWRPSAGSPRS